MAPAPSIKQLHAEAQRAARLRREQTGAPPHAVAHVRRGIAQRFAQFRTAGAGAFVAFMAVLGPGLLAGLSDDDPAGITTYSVLGTDHGYRLLWIIPASTALLVLFHLLAVRIGAGSGKGFVGVIRDRWGRGVNPCRRPFRCRPAETPLTRSIRQSAHPAPVRQPSRSAPLC